MMNEVEVEVDYSSLNREGLKDSPELEKAFRLRVSVLWAVAGDWSRMSAQSMDSNKKLVPKLQDWIARADQSGIEQLEALSLSLNNY